MQTFESCLPASAWICDPPPFVVAIAIAIAIVAGTGFAIATACHFLRLTIFCGSHSFHCTKIISAHSEIAEALMPRCIYMSVVVDLCFATCRFPLSLPSQ